MKRDKRIVFVADFHSGHEYGLTPPHWWVRDDTKYRRVSKAGKFQRELWGFYTKAIDSLKPIDILSVPGDCIDGKGERSGGKELISADRHEQARMAAEAIDYAEAPVTRITYGTKYHVGKDEDFESVIVHIVKGKVSIHGHDFFDANGVNFDVKHKVGGSAIPHGRMTAIARDRMWNVMWSAEHKRQPKADVLIRAHNHYYGGGFGSDWLGVNLPALTYNSEFGIRECSGIVNVGLVVFDVTPKGNYSWHPILADFPELKVIPEVV
jgi:hypothetical protein